MKESDERPMIEAKNLRKRFAGKEALKGVSFEVKRGEILGLLGHNGAGKSTSLGILLGMVAPDSGEAAIDGLSVQASRSAALAKVGAIFESPGFYDYLSGWDNLKILTNYSGGVDEALLADVVERVEMTSRIRSRVGTYSHGMRQRLALAQALLPGPEVLLLDEPTDGLDPEGIKWFRDFILDLRAERGMTVLFNSHLLAEVEQMCDRVVILQQGEKVFEGRTGDLEDDHLKLKIDAGPPELVDKVLAEQGWLRQGERIVLPKEADAADFTSSVIQRGGWVREVSPVKRSLEDLYLEMSKGGGR
ncbi:MAG: ABC transporter ATP-binding protein [Verrucomicrobiota bacterium JB023]|nr:ABC transporter ATP-binding protein [Verrucomicrobiota bacterium JB023]